jgi:hypothetical protein
LENPYDKDFSLWKTRIKRAARFIRATRRRILVMPAKKKTPALSLAAMAYSEGLAMSQSDRITRFKFEADASQRAFAAIGKLYRIIDANLPKGKFINSSLTAAGVKPGTISNASYGARCFDLVEGGHLTEAEFDLLTFQEVSFIARAITDKSKRKLSPAEVATMLRNSPDTFEADIKAIYETGMTAAEKTAIEEKVKADKAATEAEAKAKAERDAAELAEVKARNEELAKQNAAMVAAVAAAPADSAPAAPATPAESTPADSAPVTPAPAAVESDAAVTAEDLIALLDEVQTALALLDDESQGRVGARIVEMATAFVESGKAVAA